MKLMKRIPSCQAYWRLWCEWIGEGRYLNEGIEKLMIQARTATKSEILAQAAHVLGALLVLTCCASTVTAQDSGQKEAIFLGAIQNPGITVNEPTISSRVIPFLPTMDAATYAALKAQAAAAPAGVKPGGGLTLSRALTPETLNKQFAGLDRPGSADQGFVYTPPDVNSASGRGGQVMEVTNNHVACYDTTTMPPVTIRNNPASVFFGYTNQLFTDPRVVYDTIWQRWIVTEVAFPENPTTMIFFLAASQTSDCTGGFNVYSVNEPLAANDCYDYPQVGYDQDAIIVTFNVFNSPGCLGGPFKYGEIDFYAKARVYNGLGLGVPFINGFGGTLTPNTGRDSNATTVVLRNVVGTNQLQLIKLTNTAKSSPSSSTTTITTPEVCNVPPNAHQPGTMAQLDTLDGRFQAPGTQNGDFVWNVQTCGFPPFPIPRVLQININTNVVTQDDFIFASFTSDDFNPSLAVNDGGDVLVNWSTTDAPANLNAGAIYASRPNAGAFNAPAECFRSSTFSIAFRWGDTSGTSVDYTDPMQQTWWVSNETILNASDWGTEVCQVSRP